MVSTRQMSTTLSPAPSSNEDNNQILLPTTANRLTTTTSTRQTASAVNGGGAGGSSCNNNNNQLLNTTLVATSLSRNRSIQDDIHFEKPEQKIYLLDLPIENLHNIFSYVGYKKIGQLRVVSKKMNQVCGSLLNTTFSKLQTQMLNRFQTVKAKMPRRESARRNHPLACECDIIETCYMRLSLLQMTFGKHIERKHCCFFPGGILDEVYNVLSYIRSTPKLERPYRVTDELFDLSTMAMEYFKENIEKRLPEIGYFNKDFFEVPSSKSKITFSNKAISDISSNCTNTISSPPQSNMVLRKGIRKIKQGMKMYNNQLSVLRCELRSCKKKSSEQGKQVAEQQKLLTEQQKQIVEYANRLDENDKKNEEMSRKFSTLLQELNKCKTELQYWRSKSPAIQNCNSCGHKIAPILAQEDFQALINQGISPEDIQIDETDESNISLADTDSEKNDDTKTDFVFPDESTTAKLLAVSAIKTLKRSHDGNAIVCVPLQSTSDLKTTSVPENISETEITKIGTTLQQPSTTIIDNGNTISVISKTALLLYNKGSTTTTVSDRGGSIIPDPSIIDNKDHKNIITMNNPPFCPSASSAFNEATTIISSEKKRRVQKISKRK